MSRSLHKLENLLQSWARQRAAVAPTLHRLTAQILAEAERHTCGIGRGREAIESCAVNGTRSWEGEAPAEPPAETGSAGASPPMPLAI